MRHTKWFLASSLLCSTGVIADQADASTTTHTSVTEKFRHGEKLPKEKYGFIRQMRTSVREGGITLV